VLSVRNGCGVLFPAMCVVSRPTSHLMCTEDLFLGPKRPRLDADYSLLSSIEVKNAFSVSWYLIKQTIILLSLIAVQWVLETLLASLN